MKGFFILLLLLIFNKNIYTASSPAPANTNLGSQAVVTYTKSTGERVLSSSNPVNTKVNEVISFNLTGFSAEIKSDPKGNIDIPYRIINTGNIKDTYIISFTDPSYFQDGKFIIDENGDGSIDANEITELITIGPNQYKTPPIDLGGDLDFHFVGKLKENLEGTNLNISLNAMSDLNKIIIGNTPTKIILQNINEARIRKSIEYDENNKQLYFTFKFYNGHSDDITNIFLEDTIDKNFIINSYTGYWSPFGSNEKKAVTFFKDGYETEAPEVEVDLLNNLLNFKLKKIPANTLQTESGGILYIPFIVNPKIPADTVLKNSGTYTYDSGLGRSNSFTTNEITYVVPYMVKASLIGQTLVEKNPSPTLTYMFHNKITNEGNSEDLYSVSAVNKINFPEGTIYTFKLKNANGLFINLSDNDGDGLIDTGNIKPGETLDIYLEVKFPNSHSLDQTYSVNKLFISKRNPNYKISVTDTLRGDLKDDELGFQKFQGITAGNYTTKTLDLIEGQTVFYKFIITKKTSAAIPGKLTFEDNIPKNTILNKEGVLGEGGKPYYELKNKDGTTVTKKELKIENNTITETFENDILSKWEKDGTIEIYFNVKVAQ